MNRLKEGTAEPDEPLLPDDYFVVDSTDFGEWYVSREMAQHVEACLDQAPTPRWVVFVDVTGARVRVRTRLIAYVWQCAAAQRELERAFHRARGRERKGDRDWDGE